MGHVVIYRGGAHIKVTGNFSLKTLETRRQWSNIFNIVKGQNETKQNLSVSNSVFSEDLFQTKGKIKTFLNIQKLNEYMTSRSVL